MSALRTVVAVAAAQLRHERTRTALAVVGVAVAVLATTLLAGVGYGVVETGREQFDASGRDLWITGGSISASSGSGGFGASLLNSHEVARDVEARPEVQSAIPMAFQGVYVGNDSGETRTVVGVGISDGGPFISYEEGELPHGDAHYANGSYDGPRFDEVVVDPRTAELFDVGVGDTLYVGSSVESARNNSFTVTGISSTFSSFLGAPTVTTYLSELQAVTGTAGTDRATFVAVDLTDGANATATAQRLQRAYPEYEVRTNDEQMQSVLRQNAVVLAVGAALVVLAVVAGFALTVNVLSTVVFQQREELAALTALGMSTRTLVGMVAAQGVLLGALGGLVGVAATPPSALALDFVAAELVGFEGLVQTPGSVLVVGAAIALVMGTAAAAVAGWRTVRTVSVDQLSA